MLKNLLNKLQGKTWGARCNVCQWHAGRHDLTMQQAAARARAHRINEHYAIPLKLNLVGFVGMAVINER